MRRQTFARLVRLRRKAEGAGAGDVVNATGASSRFSLGVSNEIAIFGGGGATVVAGANTVIAFDASDSVTLQNVTATSLSQANVHFA